MFGGSAFVHGFSVSVGGSVQVFGFSAFVYGLRASVGG